MSKWRLGLWSIVVAFGILLTAVGCTKRDDTPFGLTGDAEVYLSVGLDATENEHTVAGAAETKATGLPVIDPYLDLAIYVINTHQDTLARWACFNDMPSVLKFTPGAYKVVAEYRPVATKIPSFDTYIYRAEEKFIIKAKESLHIDLVAKLGTAKISVEFDSNFDFFYQSYSVDIRTVGVDSLRFKKGESRCGFFEPGSVRMRFNLKTQEGQVLTFSPAPLTKAKAADYYKIKFKVSSDAGSILVVINGTDDELNPDKTVTIEIPKYFLPKDKPTMSEIQGFSNGVEQNVFEGAVAKWGLKTNVPGGVSSFVIRMNDGSTGVLASKLGGQTTIDLASLPEDSPMRDALKQAGFVWCAGLNSPEDAAISTNIWIDFTDVMKASPDGAEARYDFSIELKDNYDQSPETDHPCVIKAVIKAPTVTFVQPVPGNIWSTKAEFTVNANYDLVGGTHPVLQYRKASSSSWNNAQEGADGDVTVSALPMEGALYVAYYELKGLQPGTEYEFRVLSGGRASSAYRLSTETQGQIPNSNFAAYTTTARFGGILQYEWSGGWATRNAATTGQATYSVNPLTGSGDENPVTDVSSHSATTYIRIMDGSMVVQMQTTGWGRGTYSQEGGDYGKDAVLNKDDRVGSPKADVQLANITAGVLYLGSYSAGTFTEKPRPWTYIERFASKWTGNYAVTATVQYPYNVMNSETLNETGIVFGSRPKSFDFSYLFVPKTDGSGGNFKVRAELIGEDTPGHEVTLATAEWEDDAAQTSIAAADMAKRLPFQYNSAHLLVKATRLKVFFSSSTALGGVPAAIPTGFQSGNPPLTWRKDGNRHTGNTLTIKAVSLDYNF